MSKQFIKEQQLLEDSFRLGVEIYNSGFRPTVIVGLWRGGSTVGIYVQECLQHLGVNTRHIAARTSYEGADTYHEMVGSNSDIKIHGLQYLYETLEHDDALLIVDDVFNSGLSVDAVINKLTSRTKRNMPEQTRVATIWYKPENNRTNRQPDYFLHKTNNWLVLPYELTGLAFDELLANKPFMKPILQSVKHKPG